MTEENTEPAKASKSSKTAEANKAKVDAIKEKNKRYTIFQASTTAVGKKKAALPRKLLLLHRNARTDDNGIVHAEINRFVSLNTNAQYVLDKRDEDYDILYERMGAYAKDWGLTELFSDVRIVNRPEPIIANHEKENSVLRKKLSEIEKENIEAASALGDSSSTIEEQNAIIKDLQEKVAALQAKS